MADGMEGFMELEECRVATAPFLTCGVQKKLQLKEEALEEAEAHIESLEVILHLHRLRPRVTLSFDVTTRHAHAQQEQLTATEEQLAASKTREKALEKVLANVQDFRARYTRIHPLLPWSQASLS